MSEPRTFIITAEQDFDGQTVSEHKFDQDFERTGTRLYQLHTSTPLGLFGGDFWGAFSDDAPKLVGIASAHYNPRSVARVVSPNGSVDEFRHEIDLAPTVQYVTMQAGDKLAVVTEDGGRTSLTLVINEMSETDHVQWATEHPRTRHWRRFRIIRQANNGFAPLFDIGNIWRPGFFWQAASHLSVAQEVADGPIPVRSLCTWPRFAACLLRVRYSNIASAGKLHVMEPVTGAHRVFDNSVPNMQWSKTISVSHDDHIVLDAGAPAVGDTTVCDIQVARIPPVRLMLGHYNRGK